MSGNKAFPKATFVIALSCLCCLIQAQNVSKLDEWAGDTWAFDIDSKTLRCTTDDQVTIHTVQDAARGCTWTTAIRIPDGEMASIALFPVADDIDRPDGSEHFVVERNGEMRFVTARNISGSGEAYNITSLTGLDTQAFTLTLALTADGKWQVEVNGTGIFEENTLTSRSDGAQHFAVRFKGMKGATISNVTLTAEEEEQPPVDPDDGDDDVYEPREDRADNEAETAQSHGNAARKSRGHRTDKGERTAQKHGAPEFGKELINQRARARAEQRRRDRHVASRVAVDNDRHGDRRRKDREQLLQSKQDQLARFGFVLDSVDELHL